MKTNRRAFIKQTILGSMAFSGMAGNTLDFFSKNNTTKISILHTNDVHSRIEPFPDNDPKFGGLGGIARRAALIKKIRAQEKNVLLLDSGDIFQGTPYFNYYGGELEFKLMSMMGYDAATLGNHDFDNGLEGLEKQLKHANFPFLSSNYDFSNTPMKNKTIPYSIFKKDDIKIGVLGIGIELEGLVNKKNYGETLYSDPIAKANETAYLLKNELKCDLIICLSHLGYSYTNKKVSDLVLAENTKYIDLILGGHTHTFLDKPTEVKNKENKTVIINQVGWAGIRLGKIDFIFNHHKNKIHSGSAYVDVCEKISI